MVDEVYQRLAQVLDTLPNGFPATDSGVEIKLLKKIFTLDQADLFCEMRLTYETAEKVSKRTGRPLEGLDEKLFSMWERGQIFSINIGGVRVYKMMPWILGVYEFQLAHLDEEFAKLNEEYSPVFGRQFFENKPQLMQTIPIEENISISQDALTYERVSTIIENGQSFMVQECICKKEQGILGKPCKKPLEVCLVIAPIPGVLDDRTWARAISKQEAYDLLRTAEEAGLVHLASNVRKGQYYICNCCGCCCGILRGINQLGIPASDVINSHYYAEIDPDKCSVCGICADERCQVCAIEGSEGSYIVIREKCIGCGLCVSTCPEEAIQLIHKKHEKLVSPPITEEQWFKDRGRLRGVDFGVFQ